MPLQPSLSHTAAFMKGVACKANSYHDEQVKIGVLHSSVYQRVGRLSM